MEVNVPELEYLTVDHLSTKELTRLFSKIQVDKVTGCWNWIAGTDSHGYSIFHLRGRMEAAHRVIYAWLVGPLPRGWEARKDEQIDHAACDNKLCCNPCHMQVTTLRENTLRSNNCFAKNFRKTHCIKGHLLPLQPNVNGKWRECSVCRRDNRKARYYANHEESKRKGRERMRKQHGYNPRISP